MGPADFGDIKITAEDGFVDLDLSMVSFHRGDDGSQRISARGLHNRRTVGFSVRLGPTWERQDLENSEISLYWGHADLLSIGEKSDYFLQLLDEVYATNLGHQKMRDRVPYIAVSLAGDPVVEGEPVRMKLFFASNAEDRDAEFYLNIDHKARAVQFHEKDTDFRRGVVMSLSAQI